MKGFGFLMVLVGVLMLLTMFGVFELSFGKAIALAFAGVFAYWGVSSLVRKGFPRGFVSLTLATILVVHFLEVYRFSFFKGFLLIVAVAFVEWGLSLLIRHKY